MYKSIVFDLGGVMIDFDPRGYLVDRLCNAETEEEVYDLTFGSEEWKQLDAGLVSRFDGNQAMLRNAKAAGREFEVQGVLDDWLHILRPRRRMQELVRRLMGALDVREGWLLWGGYDTAQRRQAHFLPDWQTEPDFEAVAALRATFYEPNSLTHRDVLGSLMGLGVTRESVGDILVAEQSVDVLVTEPVRRFLLDSWDSAGRVRLKVQPIGPTELQVPEEKVKLLRDTVSSLRLDSVLSVGFSLSRSKAAEAVTSGKVQVNWADWQKPDRQVVQGDVLTLRGLGKCVLEEVGNQTKKGRVFITVKRYL